jgi:signal transduction histidine kinase
MIKTIVQKLKTINPWHYLWITIICSEVLTVLISYVFSLIFWGQLPRKVLVIGLIDAFIVPLVVIPIVIYLMKHAAKLQELNMRLQQEIEDRQDAEMKIQVYQGQLRALISKVSIVEEKERKRIAEELHDNLGQHLAIAKIKLAMLRKSQPDIKQNLDEIKVLMEQAITFTRSLTFELSTPILYQLGLIPALKSLAEQVQKEHGLKIELMYDSHCSDLKGEISVLLFKTVRELLLNAVKHAQAQKATVFISNHGDCIKVKCEDDGKGFDVSNLEEYLIELKKFGIFGVRERIRYLGGTFEITSDPGMGTSVSIAAPL